MILLYNELMLRVHTNYYELMAFMSERHEFILITMS
jgi:hypothetical protein